MTNVLCGDVFFSIRLSLLPDGWDNEFVFV